MTEPPRVSVVPSNKDVERAVAQARARLVDPGEADAIVWTDPTDAEGLRKTLASSPARWVQLPFAGIEEFVDAGVIDRDHVWTCAKGIYGPATAEHAMALLLLGARQLHRHVRATQWRKRGEFAGSRRLMGDTVLIVGTGGIGRALARLLSPHGPSIIAVNRSGDPMAGADHTYPVAELEKVVPRADWIVLAAAMTAETERLFNATMLTLMRPNAWVVNVGRGRLIDTDALVEALQAGRIGGAALDVTDPEPLPDDHPLWNLDNAVITSHSANTWAMAVPELAALVARNIDHYARGEELEGLVDVDAGY